MKTPVISNPGLGIFFYVSNVFFFDRSESCCIPELGPTNGFYCSPRVLSGGAKDEKIQIGFVAWFIVDLQVGAFVRLSVQELYFCLNVLKMYKAHFLGKKREYIGDIYCYINMFIDMYICIHWIYNPPRNSGK